jgi:restriction system protein
MTSYYRVMLGKGSVYAAECFVGGFIGADFGITQDLSNDLPDAWHKFNEKFIPIWLAQNPGKTKIAAGLSCGFLWTVAKGIQKGDVVLCPDGTGNYHVGEVVGDYYHVAEGNLPHRRAVHWLDQPISKSSMSDALRGSVGAIGTISTITQYAEEIAALIGGASQPPIVSTDPTIEDPATFALEKHLEDFLVQNWAQTVLGKDYAIFEEEGEKVGQQYATDSGPIDILAVRKDKKELLVVELKRGRASDVVVGQVLRYMGYVIEELAVEGQTVRGVIVALEDDPKLKRALAASPSVSFYRYHVTFTLFKA